MNKREMAQRLVAGLGRDLGLETLELDARTNSCVLMFQGDLLVNLEYDAATGRLVLSSYLDEVPATGAEPILRDLMSANLYWHRTQGATLCLEEGTGGILLVYGHAVSDLDAAGLEAVLENFVNQSEAWTARIAAQKTGLLAQAAPPADTGSILMRL